ncbi:3'(2'),5'-bisphosphate nucleotidase CysQ [Rapidithrix thailandica]|uniref:3'(2'),5'-bisphosphate nucleotidase CysQ n=1 Tax=Rapidithrix thailandica TaxID=413964 RepID=A0AAW9SB49_9BACT
MLSENFLNEWIEKSKSVAIEAGEQILTVYNSGEFGEEAKDDKSPLTLADKLAHKAIVAVLETSSVPILSEEGKDIDYTERANWDSFWLVDPLDGTKEFIKRNGEFTVNIALIEGGKPVLGVVYVPVKKEMYWAVKGQGAFKSVEGQTAVQLQCADYHLSTPSMKVVGSRSHMNDETVAFMEQLKEPEVVSMGSSLKFMLVAEGKAHVYPRLAPTMEWDTGAAQIVVEEAGGSVINYKTQQPLAYNKEILRNPYFVAYGKR